MIYRRTGGLIDVSPYNRAGMPLYLTDDHHLLEGPTLWALDMSLDVGSSQTVRKYGAQLARYLQWLDDRGYGANKWQNVDKDIAHAHIADLVAGRDEAGRPTATTIEDHMARVAAFYRWALDNNYEHYLKMDDTWIRVTIKDQTLLADIAPGITVRKHAFGVAGSNQARPRDELDKFLDRDSFKIALPMLVADDPVYAWIALIIWMTGLRPMDLAQLPFHGREENAGLRRYRPEEIEDLRKEKAAIPFTFVSKRAKRRTLNFPGDLWAALCEEWMPRRQERAALYAEKHGVNPPNSILFLADDGHPVSHRMILDHFSHIAARKEFPRDRLTPYMLRHSFATYFMLTALKKKGILGATNVYDAAIDDELRTWMGHDDIKTTYMYYVHLIHKFLHDDLIYDVGRDARINLLKGLDL